jgi:hypothetical protein
MPTELEEVRDAYENIEASDQHKMSSSSSSCTTATHRLDKPVRTTPPPRHRPRSHYAAAEHLVGYSQANLPLFKRNQLEPIKDLKLLVRDYAPIAKNAFTILINVSADREVQTSLAKDDAFLEELLSRITVCQYPYTE